MSLVPNNDCEQLKIETVNYGWLKKIGFNDQGFLPEQISNTMKFAFKSLKTAKNFISIEEFALNLPHLELTAKLALGIYNGEVRKMNGDPYFKHPLRTLVNVLATLEENEFNQEDREVLMAVALFHDAIEMRTDRDERMVDGLRSIGFTDNQIERITNLVFVLTPDYQVDRTKPIEEQRNKRIENKKNNALEIFGNRNDFSETDLKILKRVKAADILANIEETLVDFKNQGALIYLLELKIQQKDIRDILQIVEDRIEIIHKYDSQNPLLFYIEKAESQLDEIIGIANLEEAQVMT